jgi:beta-1,4-mannooligosaccharide/beta-1,4-mannosyl-N-acetylglucosamine phosphorylase
MVKHAANPVVKPTDLPGGVMYVLNPGAIRHEGEYLLMMDAATLPTPIVFWLARSRDGIHFVPDPQPIRNWPRWSKDIVEDCVYDPRITWIDGEYVILYASQAPGLGVRTGVVKTRDFSTFERVPQEETGQNNRNSILFPEKIDGWYVRFDRPMTGTELEPSDMCISYSKDLRRWEGTKTLMKPRSGCWDSHKIGGGAVPIKTDKGWLAVYHGVDRTCNGFIYRLGVMLLDRDDPSKIIARGQNPILWPEHDYEMNGRVANVTFACNALLEDDGNVKVYYGAADTCIGLAEAKLADLVDACFAPNPHILSFYGSK